MLTEYVQSRRTSFHIGVRLVAAMSAIAAIGCVAASQADAVNRISVIPGPNGPVGAITGPDSSGNRYLAGSFTAFNGWGTGDGSLVSASTGLVDPSFPKVNGSILAAVPDGSGGFFIGGTFTCIGPNVNDSCSGTGDIRRNRLARINADGSVAPSWNPGATGPVRALAVSGNTLYIGGTFSQVANTSRNNAAAVNASTGVATSWNPNVTGFGGYYGGGVAAILVANGNVYLGGSFSSVNNQQRNNAAAVNPTTGTATSWNPNVTGGYTGVVFAMTSTNGNVYLGGIFSSVGNQPRNSLAAVNATSGQLVGSWSANVSGGYDSSVKALATDGSSVFIGGSFTTIGNQARSSAAAVNAATGAVTTWNAGLDNFERRDNGYESSNPATVPPSINALAVTNGRVYLGGSFTEAGGQARDGAAAIPVSGGTAVAWDPNVNGTVNALAPAGTGVYLGGTQIISVGGQTRRGTAAISSAGALTPWTLTIGDGNVKALELAGSTVYMGGNFAKVNGQIRFRLAASSTGGVLSSWNPSVTNSGPYDFLDPISVETLKAADGNVYIGGSFSRVGGVTRNNAAAIGGTDGQVKNWNPNVLSNGSYRRGVRDIEISGSTIYLGGDFATVNGQDRSNVAAVNNTTGAPTTWDPSVDVDDSDDGVYAMAISGSMVYLGGRFSGIGGLSRNRVAAVDTNGNITSWSPNVSGMSGGSPGVYALSVANGNTVYLGGSFSRVARGSRAALAAVGANGVLSSWNPSLTYCSQSYYGVSLRTLRVEGSAAYVGGTFTKVGAQGRNFLASIGLNGSPLSWPTYSSPFTPACGSSYDPYSVSSRAAKRADKPAVPSAIIPKVTRVADLKLVFLAEPEASYTIRAKGKGGSELRGSCRQLSGVATCKLRGRPGRWVVKITPKQSGVRGPSLTRSVTWR